MAKSTWLPCDSHFYASSCLKRSLGPTWQKWKNWQVDKFWNRLWSFKVEKILKGILDSIPSPSPLVKIQILAGKVCLKCKGKTLLGIAKKLSKTKSLLTSPSNVLSVLLRQVNFPANGLNFHWSWWFYIKAIFWNLFYFILKELLLHHLIIL